MESKHIGFDLIIYRSETELNEADRNLLKTAKSALEGAYAPYSRFRVGAALLLESGQCVIGSNQENASYPSGLCAERVAVFQAGARFPEIPIKTIAIVAQDYERKLQIPAAPCGNCRQAINEYESKQNSPIRLLLQGGDGVVYECPSIASILPLGFDGSFLS
jgi:cytidine deaminase